MVPIDLVENINLYVGGMQKQSLILPTAIVKVQQLNKKKKDDGFN